MLVLEIVVFCLTLAKFLAIRDYRSEENVDPLTIPLSLDHGPPLPAIDNRSDIPKGVGFLR